MYRGAAPHFLLNRIWTSSPNIWPLPAIVLSWVCRNKKELKCRSQPLVPHQWKAYRAQPIRLVRRQRSKLLGWSWEVSESEGKVALWAVQFVTVRTGPSWARSGEFVLPSVSRHVQGLRVISVDRGQRLKGGVRVPVTAGMFPRLWGGTTNILSNGYRRFFPLASRGRNVKLTTRLYLFLKSTRHRSTSMHPPPMRLNPLVFTQLNTGATSLFLYF
jgi:hypothetical protein